MPKKFRDELFSLTLSGLDVLKHNGDGFPTRHGHQTTRARKSGERPRREIFNFWVEQTHNRPVPGAFDENI
jgi:hypothetical protein